MRELVVKDNALINASYNLDLVEQRLILLAIVEARESGKGINANDPLVVHAESYINQFNVHRNTAYQALKDACHDLFVRQFSYQKVNDRGNVEHYRSRWVSEIGYVDNEAIVKLIFAPAIVPLITRLEEQFTKYELQQVSQLTSAYAVRLYELLIAWRSTGKTPVIELADFRKRIGILETEYKRMERFKTSVLELAINQINEHTDINVAYEQHKKGRSIVGFSFNFSQKEKKKILEKAQVSEGFKKLTEAQITKYSTVLSKLHELSDLSTFQDYQSFSIWIGNILREPESVRFETAERIFSTLFKRTDFASPNN